MRFAELGSRRDTVPQSSFSSATTTPRQLLIVSSGRFVAIAARVKMNAEGRAEESGSRPRLRCGQVTPRSTRREKLRRVQAIRYRYRNNAFHLQRNERHNGFKGPTCGPGEQVEVLFKTSRSGRDGMSGLKTKKRGMCA